MYIYSFLVKLQFAFQDRDNLYLVFDYLIGGDLSYHLSKHKMFSDVLNPDFNKILPNKCKPLLVGLRIVIIVSVLFSLNTDVIDIAVDKVDT